MIDFRNLQVSPIPVPEQVEIVVVHSGQARELATSAYALRRSQLEAAQHLIGPLRDAKLVDVDTIADALARVLGNANLRVRLSDLGRAQAARFTWRAAATTLVEAYRAALA